MSNDTNNKHKRALCSMIPITTNKEVNMSNDINNNNNNNNHQYVIDSNNNFPRGYYV